MLEISENVHLFSNSVRYGIGDFLNLFVLACTCVYLVWFLHFLVLMLGGGKVVNQLLYLGFFAAFLANFSHIPTLLVCKLSHLNATSAVL